MIKKTITYPGFDGEEITEDFHFHLNKADFLEMQIEKGQDLQAVLIKMTETQDMKEMYALIKSIVVRSFGVRSADGKKFVRNTQMREEFESSEAFAELIVELLSDEAVAAEFINGIMPNMAPTVEVPPQTPQTSQPDQAVVPNEGAPITPPRVLTHAELLAMDQAELSSGLAEGRFVLGKEDPAQV